LDIEYLSSFVGNLETLSSPHLPPSWGDWIHSESLRSTVWSDFNSSISPVVRLNGLASVIEYPLLSSSVLVPSLVSKVSVTYTFNNSSEW
jgi:hypothetical protein